MQSPREDLAFLARAHKRTTGRDARHFREDFCGTALLTATWLKRHPKNTAEGFDIDPEPVSWGLARHFAELGKRAARATLHLQDVRRPSDRRPDLRCALNFSWWVFKKRAELLEYFRSAHADLKPGGVFALDILGGMETTDVSKEVRPLEEGFTYVWEQASYVPVSGDFRAHIHFRFKDRTKLERAFSYDWRVWGLPETIDALRDAGFERVDTYWEGGDEDGESGNGRWRFSKTGEDGAAWITYVLARKARR